MSRADLDSIQRLLKLVIQRHQVVVSQMKNDPQNVDLQKQLHELQAEIQKLSQQQRAVVQQLRKELVNKQSMSDSLNKQSMVKEGLQQNKQIPKKAPSSTSSCSTASTVAKKPVGQAKAFQRNPSSTTTGLTSKNGNSPQRGKSSPTTVKVSPPRGKSPPIRVPQYTPHRPSILQGRPTLFSGSTTTAAKPASTNNAQVPPVKRATTEPGSDHKRRVPIDTKSLSPEQRQKVEYMASLELITQDTLKELQNRRSERKRRSTANPQFSYGNFEPERKKVTATYLSPLMQGVKRPRGRPPKNGYSPANSRPGTPSGSRSSLAEEDVDDVDDDEDDEGDEVLVNDVHEDFCAVCQKSGELLMCDTCNLVYHLQCLDPPLTEVPSGMWSCPKCQAMGKVQPKQWPGTLALVHSYIAFKSSKEEEKRKLQKKAIELEIEKKELEKRAKEYSNSITEQMVHKAQFLRNKKDSQKSLEKLNSFVRVFQSGS
ncbi:PHD finger protein 21A isoform X2 [Lingula anatina]|uniref:PHD finger protein 21A isoform X2 n=1 Tax=Lingula anatina TaxID=7574 RepID=A0A1S3IDY4_LINAN|nr:PHD finger protein 21A isoform X2 [Lingula anatina]|eukprot:XP_013396066.1 PHD finger protein 21A isoform X2 [Lingula anatina]